MLACILAHLCLAERQARPKIRLQWEAAGVHISRSPDLLGQTMLEAMGLAEMMHE
jgi:hypothetical protein